MTEVDWGLQVDAAREMAVGMPRWVGVKERMEKTIDCAETNGDDSLVVRTIE